jgi:hypothetical protein
MALQIKDETMLRQIEQLSRARNKTKTGMLRELLENEIKRETGKTPVRELLAPVLAKVAALGPTRRTMPEEDKRFSDELWGEE